MRMRSFLLLWFSLSLSLVATDADITPVIFIHRGDSSYLHDSLWQAAQYNQRVIMIGDQTNNHYGVEHYLIEDYFEDAAAFAHVYRHLHTCNSLEYELFCIQRWFILHTFMQRHMLPRAFYCDSDVMLYCNVTEELTEFKNFDIALMVGDPSCLTSHIGHITLFTLSGISALCSYMKEFYTDTATLNRWISWLNDPERVYGQGISDMVLISEFAKSHILPIGAINRATDHSTFDINLNQDDGFAQCNSSPITLRRSINGIMQESYITPLIKHITWIHNKPYAFNIHSQSFVRFKGLHFQGILKQLMKNFRKEKLL